MRIKEVALGRALQEDLLGERDVGITSNVEALSHALDVGINRNGGLAKGNIEHDISGFAPHTWQGFQLSARLSALFRRADAARAEAITEEVIEDGPLRLRPEQMRVSWRGQDLDLTVTELWILHALARHPGHVKSREQLMDAADTYVDLATITSHIKRIRRKFERIDPDFDAIEAVYGAGYRWLSPRQ